MEAIVLRAAQTKLSAVIKPEREHLVVMVQYKCMVATTGNLDHLVSTVVLEEKQMRGAHRGVVLGRKSTLAMSVATPKPAVSIVIDC